MDTLPDVLSEVAVLAIVDALPAPSKVLVTYSVLA